MLSAIEAIECAPPKKFRPRERCETPLVEGTAFPVANSGAGESKGREYAYKHLWTPEPKATRRATQRQPVDGRQASQIRSPAAAHQVGKVRPLACGRD